MKDLLACIRFGSIFTRTVCPTVNRKTNEYYNYTKRIKKISAKSNAEKSLQVAKFDSAVYSVCMLYPKVNVELASEVMFSYQTIVRYLRNICESSSVNTEPFVRLVFSSLKDALNIRSDSFEKYFTFFPSKDDNGYLSLIVEKCRQKVQSLPSFNVVRDSIVAYLAFFIDLQLTKYSSDDNIKEVNLINWSSAHMQNYSDISNWEFCMSVDSTLSIHILLALATIPDLTEDEADAVIASYFPWICGIQQILEGYLNYNDDLFSKSINYLFYYPNLKDYQDRIIYFINKALSFKSANSNYFNSVLKILISLYITHPIANEGMNTITSKALRSAGGKWMSFYMGTAKLIKT